MNRSTILLDLARWMTLASIGLAVALYGGVRPWTREIVEGLLLLNLGLFVVGLATRRRWPRVPWTLGASTLFLCASGWFMAANAERQFVAVAGVWIEQTQLLPGLPGSVDRAMTWRSLLLWTGLWGASWIVCDAAAQATWRRRIWGVFLVFGSVFVVSALWQRMAEAPSIYWEDGPKAGGTFFGTFRYHANAGAFLNAVLPFCVAMAVWAFRPGGESGWRVAGVLSSVFVVVGGLVNVSRAANLLLIVLLVGMAFGFRPSVWDRGWMVGTIGLLVAVVLLAASVGLDQTASRWETAVRQVTGGGDGRWLAWTAIVRDLLPKAGLWGTGAGTFEPVFQTREALAGAAGPEGRWDHAHCDLLQALVEWGWLGTAAWLVFFGGALGRTFALWIGARRGEGRLFAGACGLSLGGLLLHALVDFPLQIPALQLVAATVAGACYGQRIHHSEKMISHRDGDG